MGSCSSEGLFPNLSRGLLSQRRDHQARRWHRSGVSVLAVLPAAGLAVVALAAPARAEDQPLSPVPPSAVHVGRSLTIVVDEPDAGIVSDVPASPEQATPPTPATGEPALDADAIEVTEIPANVEPSPGAFTDELAPSAPQVSVIPPQESGGPVTAPPSAGEPPERGSLPRVEAQYQSSREQYQHEAAPVVTRGNGAAPTGEDEPARASEGSTSGPAIGDLKAVSQTPQDCAESGDGQQQICSEDRDSKSGRNCVWIRGCISDLLLEEAFPEAADFGDVAVPELPECDEATASPGQYQATGGQYQPGSPIDPEDDAGVDSVDEDTGDSDEEAVCDADDANEAPLVPGPSQQPPVGDPAGSDVPLEQPATAPANPVEPPDRCTAAPSAPPPGVASGRVGTAVAPRPVGKVNGDDGWRLVVAGEPERPGAVLGSTIEHEAQVHVDVRRQPIRQSTRPSPKPSSPTPRHAAPASRVRAVASPPLTSRPDEPFADGVRLLALAMALCSLAMLGLALAGPIVRLDWSVLDQAVSLVRSKGLSRSAPAVDGSDDRDERAGGIRYRE